MRDLPLRKSHNQDPIDETPATNNVNSSITNVANTNANNNNYSPPKISILRRNDSSYENKIYGNAMLAAYNYSRDFKVKYALISHSYSTSLEASL